MTTTFIILLFVAIAIDIVTLAVVGYSLHQAVSNLAALKTLGLTNGRTIVAKALIRRTAIQAAVVVLLAALSSFRIWQIHNGQEGSAFSVSALFTIQILVATSAIYDVIERVSVIRWYDAHPGAREYEARAIENEVVPDPRSLN